MDTARNKQINSTEPDSRGRVAIDSRGRNVWQWSDDQLDSTSIMLQSLDNASLALEQTRKLRRPDVEAAGKSGQNKSRPSQSAGEQATKKTAELNIEQTISFKVGGGFDPYNSS